MKTPENLVKNFIEDFFHWNNKSVEMTALQQTKVEFHQIEAEYQKIIEKYCRPNFQPLGVAFGSNSRHHPDNEKIISVETTDYKSIVKTQNTIYYRSGKFVSDYEFHLIYENERWFLEQVFYVNEEGKYESL